MQIFLKYLCVFALFLFVNSHFITASAVEIDLPNTKHRDVKDATNYPYSAIGTVNWAGFSSRSSCTGTLIAEDVVATAAHCLINPVTGKTVNANMVHFSAGYQKENFIAHTTAIEIIHNGEFDINGNVTNEQIRNDWALLRLKDPIGKKTGYLGWGVFSPKTLGKTINPKGKVLVAGYPRDRIHALSVETKCGLQMAPNDSIILRHSCKLVEGDSGGPIAIIYKTYATLIGINSATHSNGTNYAVTMAPLEKHMAKILNKGKSFTTKQAIAFTKGHRPEKATE